MCFCCWHSPICDVNVRILLVCVVNACVQRLRPQVVLSSGLPFSHGFADFCENEVSKSVKKKLMHEKKIRPNLFLKRQLKLTQTASKLQPRADNRILHLVFALQYEISRDQPVAIVFCVKMPRSDFVRRHEAAFRDFHIFLVGALSHPKVFWGMESEPMLTPRGKSALLEAQRRVEHMTSHHTGEQGQHTTN